ncbi:hypothetical protein [Tessaracoccus aquimaris]|uniref:hypothetical protein n=1 Tax=Tessaracoccus aquimaris TaxID=1332264 RepID=UPI0009895322|nr:hypothetical protein [Tessaracoccus aquimaris]
MRVTAAGSLPGTDFRGALTAMTEALPEVLPLPELPARGVASQLVGRALGLIDGLGFDLQPAGWRLTPHSTAEQRRARAQWRNDLDDTEELLQGFDQTLKVGVAGPWTLAACVERPMGTGCSPTTARAARSHRRCWRASAGCGPNSVAGCRAPRC